MKTKTQRIFPVQGVAILMISSALAARAAGTNDLLGADGFLQAVSAQLAAQSSTNAVTNASDLFRADLKAFDKSSESLAPGVAASQWLALADRAAELQAQRGVMPSGRPVRFQEVLEVLPSPAAWPELSKAAEARPAGKGKAVLHDNALRFLGAVLTGDDAKRERETINFQAFARAASPEQSYGYVEVLTELKQAASAASANPDDVIKTLNYQVRSATANSQQSIQVPDLVSEIGPEAAEKFLREALVRQGVSLEFNNDNPTSRLAQKLALELISDLKAPQWSLINNIDCLDLYEAMDKKFNAQPAAPAGTDALPEMPHNMGGDEDQAKYYYLFGLICHGRTTNAVEVAKKFGTDQSYWLNDAIFDQLTKAGYAEAVDDFFYTLLQQDPTLPFWDAYISSSAQAGKTGRMLTLARQAAARQDLSDHNFGNLQRILTRALLADDQVEEGVQVMRRVISSNSPAWGQTPGELGVQLARIGNLTHHPEWTDEGIEAARKWLARSSNPSEEVSGDSEAASDLAGLLEAQNRNAEAETVLVSAVAKQAKLMASRRGMGSRYAYAYGRYNTPAQLMVDLVLLYHRAGRPADVVALLEKSPYWGVADLHQLMRSEAGEQNLTIENLHGGSSGLSLPYLAASALADVGRKTEALTITHALLQTAPGSDRGYELLLALDPTNALAQMDVLFARDQFEERPLIWKATLLKQQGQLEDAEKTVRRAISIDPSDGEEGRGDRMRAYAVLADIREARGDQKEAQFFREVVKSIRMSEDADQYFLNGMLKRAVALYEDALNHFADAYCIQSRLARQLAALGQNDEAAEHYRRAFELMPDSFGRVESHCFGCERAFSGPRAQNIAEQVFTQLATERPDKPQIHYLLGYLHVEEERYSDALTNFQTAVRLDPDYLNAWGKLDEISSHVLMPAAQRDDIQLNILRLDPQSRHCSPSLEYVTDLKKLWELTDKNNKSRPAPIGDLFALPASAAAMKTAQTQDTSTMGMDFDVMDTERSESTIKSPGAAVAQNAYVKIAGDMMDITMYDTSSF